jgi:uncharacterized protein YcbX
VSAITVTGLATYPIKSCAGLHLQEAGITPRGLKHDRDFMVVDDDASFISQRQVAELALVRPTLGESSIRLAAPGMPDVEFPLELEPDDDTVVAASVHGKPVSGQLVGPELDDWFTAFLPRYKENRGFRLLRVCEDRPRYINPRYQQSGASNQVGFADSNAMLLASEPSLAKLNTELEEPVPMNRFRPNIVVDGEGLAAYDEDYWLQVQIGGLTAFVVKACDRCVIPDVDQRTAAVGKTVRRALVTRRGVNAHDDSNKGVFFAQNLNHVYTPGIAVCLGDMVEVVERSSEPNVLLAAR